MALKKVKGMNGRYNQNLIDRIDNMTDDKDFDPYKATKKRTMSNEQAFDDSIYHGEDDDDVDEYGISTKTPKWVVALVIGIAVIIVGGLGFALYKFL